MHNKPLFEARDLRAIARLINQATGEVTTIVEDVHRTIGTDPLGITPYVYKSIRGINQLVGFVVDKTLIPVERVVAKARNEGQHNSEGVQLDSPERMAVLAALNGVLGDRLDVDQSHLAIDMQLQVCKPSNRSTRPANKLLIVVHGLCMNDLQWGNSVEMLQNQLDFIPAYLRYNTGLAVEENGIQFAAQIEQLLQSGPLQDQAIESISILGFSMGGLVARCAVEAAIKNKHRWLKKLNHVVFLGTPHKGAPLEQIGDWIEQVLGNSRLTKPFTKLTRLRSKGINSLKDGLENRGSAQSPDQHFDVLNPTIDCRFSFIAGCTASQTALEQSTFSAPFKEVFGDGLVPIDSALLGQRALSGKSNLNQFTIIYETNHLALLRSRQVFETLKRLLT